MITHERELLCYGIMTFYFHDIFLYNGSNTKALTLSFFPRLIFHLKIAENFIIIPDSSRPNVQVHIDR